MKSLKGTSPLSSSTAVVVDSHLADMTNHTTPPSSTFHAHLSHIPTAPFRLSHWPATVVNTSSSGPSSPPSLFDNDGASTAAATSPPPLHDEYASDSLSGENMEVEEGGWDAVAPSVPLPEQHNRAPKRRRLRSGHARKVVDDALQPLPPVSGPSRLPSSFTVPGRQLSMHALVGRRVLGGFRGGPAQLSMRPYLLDFVSHNEQNVYRCPSTHAYRNFAPPFALAFSRAAKAGGKQTLAVADEEGRVSFVDAAQDADFDAVKGRTAFQAHHNAIFDVAWSYDDHLLATASGDQTVKLWDAETHTCVGVLAGHTCTIKTVSWDPSNPSLLATASRDGAIRVWDRRVAGVELKNPVGPTSATAGPPGTSVATVNMMKNAHGTKGKSSKGLSAVKSVTSVAFLPHDPNLLASSGSADSMIKVWDLRKSHGWRANPAHFEASDAGAETGIRARGVVSMVASPDGTRLYVLTTDSRLTALDSRTFTPVRTYQHPEMNSGSFYVRTAVSSCSRYVACGSTDAGVYLWDTEGNGRDGVRLLGHEKETSGLDWGGPGSLASCGDDGIVRTWKAREREARAARRDQETRWRWSGAEE